MAGTIAHTSLNVPVRNRHVWCYLAHPVGNGPWPGVLVIQEWWGLDPHIMDITQRFARESYVALAPDLYHGQVTSDPQEAMAILRGGFDQAAAVE